MLFEKDGLPVKPGMTDSKKAARLGRLFLAAG
jgi:hypothetical protein